jgi:hypothetical protein
MLECEQDGKEADKGSKGIFHHTIIIFAGCDKSNGNMVIKLAVRAAVNKIYGEIASGAIIKKKERPRNKALPFV